MRILLAEDEQALAKAIVKIFEKTTTLPTPFLTEKTRFCIFNRAITT